MRLARPGPSRSTRLTVVGGFLGAGKTTFLNWLLAGSGGRHAVLVDDCGTVDLDARLIAEHGGETIRLTGGCLCCSPAGGSGDALLRVIARKPPFDRILIEASGIGDPGAIAAIARVAPGLVLDAVIVLVDGERILDLLADGRVGDTVARQIRAADTVLLNKVDLLDEADRLRARDALGTLRPGLRIVDTMRAAMPDDVLHEVFADEVLGRTGAARTAPGRFRADELRPDEVRHEQLFATVTYLRGGTFDPGRLAASLAAMPAALMRLKGLSRLADRDGPQVLQMVGPRWAIGAAPTGLPVEWPIELVGIGIGAGLGEVEPLLDDALVAGDSAPPMPELQPAK